MIPRKVGIVIPALRRALRVATLVSVIAWSSFWREAPVIPEILVLKVPATTSPMWEVERAPKSCPFYEET